MPITVPYEELEGSPTETRGRDSFEAVRRFKVAWSDRLTARDELLTLPGDEYPHSPVLSYCVSVSCEPFGLTKQGAISGNGRMTDYDFATLTARYESVRSGLAISNPNPSEPNTYISEDLDGEVFGVPINTELLYWDVFANLRPVQPQDAPTKMLYRSAYTLTRHHLQTLPTNYASLVGGCNAQPFQTKLLGLTFAPETLMYIGPRISIVASLSGEKRFNIAHRFTHFEPGWNKYPNPGDDGVIYWEPIYIKSETEVPTLKAVPLVNLSSL